MSPAYKTKEYLRPGEKDKEGKVLNSSKWNRVLDFPVIIWYDRKKSTGRVIQTNVAALVVRDEEVFIVSAFARPHVYDQKHGAVSKNNGRAIAAGRLAKYLRALRPHEGLEPVVVNLQAWQVLYPDVPEKTYFIKVKQPYMFKTVDKEGNKIKGQIQHPSRHERVSDKKLLKAYTKLSKADTGS